MYDEIDGFLYNIIKIYSINYSKLNVRNIMMILRTLMKSLRKLEFW